MGAALGYLAGAVIGESNWKAPFLLEGFEILSLFLICLCLRFFGIYCYWFTHFGEISERKKCLPFVSESNSISAIEIEFIDSCSFLRKSKSENGVEY